MLVDMDTKNSTAPRLRRKLNQNQLDILTRLYKFRFGTTDLLARSLGKKKGGFVHPRLTTLAQQGYIARRFDGSYHLQGKHASYYLLPQGLRVLQERTPREDINDATIKNSYKDKTVKEPFINHHLAVYAIHNQLKALYPDMKLFTKRELTIYDYFPKPSPDGYISLRVGDNTHRFFLELFEEATPPFVIDQRLRQLIAYYEDGEWEVTTDSLFPPILCVCDTGKLEKRLSKQVTRALGRSDTDVAFYTTTQSVLLGSSRECDMVECERLEGLARVAVTRIVRS